MMGNGLKLSNQSFWSQNSQLTFPGNLLFGELTTNLWLRNLPFDSLVMLGVISNQNLFMKINEVLWFITPTCRVFFQGQSEWTDQMANDLQDLQRALSSNPNDPDSLVMLAGLEMIGSHGMSVMEREETENVSSRSGMSQDITF